MFLSENIHISTPATLATNSNRNDFHESIHLTNSITVVCDIFSVYMFFELKIQPVIDLCVAFYAGLTSRELLVLRIIVIIAVLFPSLHPVFFSRGVVRKSKMIFIFIARHFNRFHGENGINTNIHYYIESNTYVCTNV